MRSAHKLPYRQDPLSWIILAAIFVFIVGVLIPGIVAGRSRPLALNQSFEAVSEDPNALVLMDTSSAPQIARLKLVRTTTTSAAENDTVATIDSILNVYANNTLLSQINDSVEVNRESIYPALGGANLHTLTIDFLKAGTSEKNSEREGLSFFFPAKTEQRSYPYYDLPTQTSHPIDYDRKEMIKGHKIYVYKQSTNPEPLYLSFDKDSPSQKVSQEGIFQRKGKAKDFYTAEELQALSIPADSSANMKLYYHVNREIKVEPVTGTIVDMEEAIQTFFATSDREAQETVDLGLSPQRRAVMCTNLRWNEQTRNQALDYALPVVKKYQTLAAVEWGARLLSAILLVLAAGVYLRRKKNG